MRLSVQTAPQGTGFAELRDFWQAADALGLHAAYTCDHLVPLRPFEGPQWPGTGDRQGGQLDGWITVAALATATSRLRTGVLVSDVTLREPAVLAKMAVSVDRISAGRAVLGIGAGWHREEHAMFGIAFPPAPERVDRLQEALGVIRTLLATPEGARTDGQHYRLRQAYFRPQAAGLPILVGGSGRRVRAAASVHADVFNSFADPAGWSRLNRELDALVTAAGRSPRALARSAYVFAELSGDPAREAELLTHVGRRAGRPAADGRTRTVLADPEAALRVLRDFAQAGVDEVVLGLRAPYRVEDLERLAAAVLPHIG